LPEIREQGADLVVVGNGNAGFAAAFREDLGLPPELVLLVDPELRAYRAAGLRRGRVEVLSPRLPLNALRAFRAGFRQTGVEGDPFQLGGIAAGSAAFGWLARVTGIGLAQMIASGCFLLLAAFALGSRLRLVSDQEARQTPGPSPFAQSPSLAGSGHGDD
ncbi:MAG: peroxiredoxin-like family protein, partial [Blastocatellia bacterium]